MHQTKTPSTAHKPDLDWSQVRETITMLTLAVAQIECSMSEGDRSVTEVTHAFTLIASQLNQMVQESATNEASTDKSERMSVADIQQQVVNAIVNFQFYDRLSQRLNHVKRDLNWLSELVSSPEQLYNPGAWKKLQDDIASNYSMEEERIMFQHIMQGASVEQALEIYRHHFSAARENGSHNNDEVELF